MIKLSREQKQTLRRLAEDYLLLLIEARVQCDLEPCIEKVAEEENKYIDSRARKKIIAAFFKSELGETAINEELLDFALRNEAFREMLEERKYEGDNWLEDFAQIHAKYGVRKQALLEQKSSSLSQERLMFDLEKFIREGLAQLPVLETQIFLERQQAGQREQQQRWQQQ